MVMSAALVCGLLMTGCGDECDKQCDKLIQCKEDMSGGNLKADSNKFKKQCKTQCKKNTDKFKKSLKQMCG